MHERLIKSNFKEEEIHEEILFPYSKFLIIVISLVSIALLLILFSFLREGMNRSIELNSLENYKNPAGEFAEQKPVFNNKEFNGELKSQLKEGSLEKEVFLCLQKQKFDSECLKLFESPEIISACKKLADFKEDCIYEAAVINKNQKHCLYLPLKESEECLGQIG